MAPMKAARREPRPRPALERLNLRLPSDMLDAIDAARACRAGNVSRNTWITEAVQEKLSRSGAPERSKGEEV
mgnify:FL=1